MKPCFGKSFDDEVPECCICRERVECESLFDGEPEDHGAEEWEEYKYREGDPEFDEGLDHDLALHALRERDEEREEALARHATGEDFVPSGVYVEEHKFIPGVSVDLGTPDVEGLKKSFDPILTMTDLRFEIGAWMKGPEVPFGPIAGRAVTSSTPEFLRRVIENKINELVNEGRFHVGVSPESIGVSVDYDVIRSEINITFRERTPFGTGSAFDFKIPRKAIEDARSPVELHMTEKFVVQNPQDKISIDIRLPSEPLSGSLDAVRAAFDKKKRS